MLPLIPPSSDFIHDLASLWISSLLAIKNKIVGFFFSSSLFGAYRYQNPLPWDTDVDIFLRAEEIEKIDNAALVAQFKEKGFNIFYSYRSGAYKIDRDAAHGDFMLYKNYSGSMKRIGIESYYAYFNYEMHHKFPADTIETPLGVIL